LDPLLPKQVRYQAALHADNQYSNLNKSASFPRGNIFLILFGVHYLYVRATPYFELDGAWRSISGCTFCVGCQL
jgi:hypothetical protein